MSEKAFELVEDFAESIIRVPDKFVWVNKQPQVGFTTSLGKVCLKMGLKFAEFAPTNKILDTTVKEKIMDEGREYCKIASNKEMCGRAIEYKFFDMYRLPPYVKPEECRARCGYHRAINEDWQVYGITYEKFRSLNVVDDNTNKCRSFFRGRILDKLFKTDVILLDEFDKMIRYKPPAFFIDDLEKVSASILLLRNYKDKDYLNSVIPFLEVLKEGLEYVPNDKEHRLIDIKDKKIKFAYADNIGVDVLNTVDIYRKVAMNIFESGDMNNKKLRNTLVNALMCMTYDEIYVSHIKYHDRIRPYAFANVVHPLEDLRPYLNSYNGKVIATGMAELPPLKTLPFVEAELPDYNNTEAKHLIVCDGREQPNLSNLSNFERYEDEICKMILKCSKRLQPIKVLVFCFNKKIHYVLEKWRKKTLCIESTLKDVLIEPMILNTYYYSDLSSGVYLDYRIKIYIGLPEIPKNAYFGSEIMYNLSSDMLREMAIKSELKNALGRGKDPKGIKPSIAYILLCEIERCKNKLPRKKEIVQIYTEGTMLDVCGLYPNYWHSNSWGFGIDKMKKQVPIDILPQFIDMMRLVGSSEETNVTIRDIYNAWERKDEINAQEIRKIANEALKNRWLPKSITFDGRSTFKHRLTMS